MKKETRLICVWLTFRGSELNPDTISNNLNLHPSKSHRKGLPKQNSPSVLAKTGLWRLEVPSKSASIEDHVDAVLEKLNGVNMDLSSMEGVNESFIDIFIAQYDENKNRSSSYLIINKKQIQRIASLGLEIQITS
jgi:Domain of unknown function (DUF4279)